ncbi:MAG: hypothetical protein GKS05_04995 [Nitrospirales bacterium]|nr:hypothetical protein [Nitrospirales bacterium]
MKKHLRKINGVGFLVLWLVMAQGVWAEAFRIEHHTLDLQLNPDSHSLIVRDSIMLAGTETSAHTIRLVLNQALHVDAVTLDSQAISYTEEPIDVDTLGDEWAHAIPDGRTIVIDIPYTAHPRELLIVYHGEINGPPQASQGLRFVGMDKTNGHIGPQGVYVSSETLWYPDIPGSLATFDVRVVVPEGWQAMTQGRQISHQAQDGRVMTAWQAEMPTEALTLVANRFVMSHRMWQGIELATYLFPEEAHLAEAYLDAVVKYLHFYSSLLGPYPFAKFAVVENFFPSGLGMPSFTLLGSGVVKRRYVQPYSLGHEIVHSWIGNAVLNRVEHGNWVEGLTTYLANYYYDERHGSIDTAIQHRRKMVLGYNVYVSPDNDYPLRRFHHKETERDNAIGYQKGAMVFHMLRREIGDEAFFGAIRAIVHHDQGRFVNWSDLQHAFEKTANQKLGWFFQQWVQQSGAPTVKLAHTAVHVSDLPSQRFEVTGTIVQLGVAYRMRIPLLLSLANGETQHVVVSTAKAQESFSIVVTSQPVRLRLDPEFELIRNISRSQIPPMLNLWATDQRRAIAAPQATEQAWPAYESVLQRVRGEKSFVTERSDTLGKLMNESLLILGRPRVNVLATLGFDACGGRVSQEGDQTTIQGQDFTGPEIAVLISCRHPQYSDHVVTILYGHSPAAVARIARLVFFYGWDSYIVFQDGHVLARGDFPLTMNNEEVRFDVS